MATQKPISTISYNTEKFLKEKLDLWVEKHIIQCYMYIKHIGEDGDKDHIHLRIEPNKKVDPMDFTELLKEYDPKHTKPLSVRPWRPSKEEDWILYAVHDREYLTIKYGDESNWDKGEKLPYEWQQIVVSEDYDMQTAFIRAKQSLKHSNARIIDRLKNGESGLTLVNEGNNPFLVRNLVGMLGKTPNERLAAENEKLADEANEWRIKYLNLINRLEEFGLSVEIGEDDQLKFTQKRAIILDPGYTEIKQDNDLPW